MKKCCICKKIMWPWQKKSLIGIPDTHLKCHQKLIKKLFKDKNISLEVKIDLIKEIKSFEVATKINTKLIP